MGLKMAFSLGRSSKNGFLASSWDQLGHLGGTRGHLVAILGDLGAILTGLGAILGPSCPYLGPSWGHLGQSWGHLGAILCGPRVSSGDLGDLLRALGAILGLSWPTWGHLGPSKRNFVRVVLPSWVIFLGDLSFLLGLA